MGFTLGGLAELDDDGDRIARLRAEEEAAASALDDLAVRLTYAGAEHSLVADPVAAIASCPPGRVEVLANYTAFRDLNTALEGRRA